MSLADAPQIVLASASPRRRALLDQIRVRYRVRVADIDESTRPGEAPDAYVRRMAERKAAEISNREKEALPVLGADTSVILDRQILGKPVDRADAVRLLKLLSGRTHEVFSAVAVVLSNGRTLDALSITRVTFSTLNSSWIETYCDSGDPMDKAGAYGVQGLAAQKISHVDGSYSGVMGLPLYETSELLRAAGVLD
jgi:septum formation protein